MPLPQGITMGLPQNAVTNLVYEEARKTMFNRILNLNVTFKSVNLTRKSLKVILGDSFVARQMAYFLGDLLCIG